MGGIKHLIESGVTGITYESGTDDSLVSSIKQLIENRDMANKLALAGKRMAFDNYDWKFITQKLIKLYQCVLNENTIH